MRSLSVIAVGVALFAASTAQTATPTCDRACLEKFVDQYLDAAIAHDPTRAPFAKNVKFTENGQRLELGDSLWRTITAKGAYRLFVTDVHAGRVAFLGSITEDNTPAMLALHLKVADSKISEVETLVQRSDKSAQGFDKIGYTWTQPIPSTERMSREDLVRIANMYFTGLEKNDGKGVYPFSDDCNRIENGQMTTNVPVAEGKMRPDPKTATTYSANWSCKEQFESGLIHFVTRVRDRRYVAVDPERGLVFSYIFFDHSAGDTRTFKTPDGRTVSAGPRQPWTWELAEAFRIEKGKIHQIVAIMERSPYGMTSGWSTWDEGMSSKARDVTK